MYSRPVGKEPGRSILPASPAHHRIFHRRALQASTGGPDPYDLLSPSHQHSELHTPQDKGSSVSFFSSAPLIAFREQSCLAGSCTHEVCGGVVFHHLLPPPPSPCGHCGRYAWERLKGAPLRTAQPSSYDKTAASTERVLGIRTSHSYSIPRSCNRHRWHCCL